MKILDARFVGGTILTGVGTIGIVAGIFSLLPPTSNIMLGILLAAVCLPMTLFGYRFAKNVHPDPAKTSVEILRKAGLINKKK